MVVDGAGWHRNQELRLPRNLQLLFLLPYAPERNPVEHLWDDVREKSFHNRSLTASSPWKHTSNRRSPTSRSPPLVHEELRGGPGVFTHYLIRNRIKPTGQWTVIPGIGSAAGCAGNTRSLVQEAAHYPTSTATGNWACSGWKRSRPIFRGRRHE